MAAGALVAPTQAYAQGPVIVQFYHGKGDSRAAAWERDNGVVPTLRTRIATTLPEDSEVCIQVINAHPVLYGYSMVAEVDTTLREPLDATSFVSALGPLFGAQGQITRAHGRVPTVVLTSSQRTGAVSPDSTVARINRVRKLLDYGLAEDVRQVQAAIRASDEPGLLDYNAAGIPVVRPKPDGASELAHAHQVIRERPILAGRFNDPNLSRTIQSYSAIIDSAVESSDSAVRETYRWMGERVKERAATLLELRNTLRDTYMRAKPLTKHCGGVKRGRTTFSLRVQRRDTLAAVARDTGQVLLKLDVASYYPRPVIEIIPVAYGVFRPNLPEFAIRDSVLTRSTTDVFRFRAGTMLVINPLITGPDRSIALGAGLGLGLGGEGETVSDLLVGAILSYRDFFRIGVGAGWAELADRLKHPAVEGRPLPPDTGELDDLIETRKRGALFPILQLAGLSLPLVQR